MICSIMYIELMCRTRHPNKVDYDRCTPIHSAVASRIALKLAQVADEPSPQEAGISFIVSDYAYEPAHGPSTVRSCMIVLYIT
jgi:hypothetical protein